MTVTAGDMLVPEGVEVLNKDLVIANLEAGAVLEMDMKARNGRGYVSADGNSSLIFMIKSLMFKIIVVTSSSTPGIEVNS